MGLSDHEIEDKQSIVVVTLRYFPNVNNDNREQQECFDSFVSLFLRELERNEERKCKDFTMGLRALYNWPIEGRSWVNTEDFLMFYFWIFIRRYRKSDFLIDALREVKNKMGDKYLEEVIGLDLAEIPRKIFCHDAWSIETPPEIGGCVEEESGHNDGFCCGRAYKETVVVHPKIYARIIRADNMSKHFCQAIKKLWENDQLEDVGKYSLFLSVFGQNMSTLNSVSSETVSKFFMDISSAIEFAPTEAKFSEAEKSYEGKRKRSRDEESEVETPKKSKTELQTSSS